jgi:hypothetical protein
MRPLVRTVKYWASGSLGIAIGLTPLIVIAVVVAVLVSHTDLRISLPLDNDSAQELASGTLSLLVAFLVSKNIDISLSINAAVDAVRTTAVELASLAHSLAGDNPACDLNVGQITEAAHKFLECVLEETAADGTTVDDALLATLRAVHRLKTSRSVEPAVVPVFVRAASACYDAHSTLWTLRELSGTPPSIKVTVYAITLFNIIFTLSDMDATERTRIGAACFVAIASIGAYAISIIVRDPLDWEITSGTARRMIADSMRVVDALRSGQCRRNPQDIASVIHASRRANLRFRMAAQ